MTEFSDGIFNIIKESSAALAIIYTLGHIVISIAVVTVITQATIFEASAVALIEPAINGCWFYVLHKTWVKWNA